MRLLAACLVVLLGTPGWGAGDEEDALRKGVYRGRVVDVETTRPLEGVLVVMYWFRDVTGGERPELHAATEVLTDTGGHFAIAAAAGIASDPSIIHVHAPEFVIFKPGYVRGRVRARDPLRDPIIIEMHRVADPTVSVELALSADFPYGGTPLLVKLLEAERSRLGLPPIRQRAREGRE
jgi:hypothetical protein